MPERRIRELLKSEMMIDEVQLPEFQIDAALADLIPRSFCQRQLVVPLKLEGRRLLLAMADPLDEGLIDEVRFTAGLDINAVTADVAAIRKKIDDLYGGGEVDFKELETLVSSPDPYEGIEIVIEDDDATKLEDLRIEPARHRGAARHPAGQCDHPRSDPPWCLRHPHPATDQERRRPLPDRRRPGRQDPHSAPPAPVAGLAPEDHVGTRHFRTAAPPGRPDHRQDARCAWSTCAFRRCRRSTAKKW